MNGLENSDMAVLYATPVILADGDNLNSVTKDFRVSLGNDQNTKSRLEGKSRSGGNSD